MALKEDIVTVSSSEEKKTGRTYVQWLVAILVGTTLLNYGLQSGWISPMKKVLQSDTSPSGVPLTDTEISWIASSMPLGAIFGTSIYAFIADAYGRKIGVLAMIVPQAMCWIIKSLSTHIALLIVARLCAGIPAGGCYNLIPMYVKEISQDNIRGTLVALTMAFPNVGYLTMYAMGAYLDYDLVLWIMIGISVVAAVILITVPESPAYLVKRGKIEEAAKTVASLRGLDINDEIVKNELDYMKKEEEYYKSIKGISFISIFKNKAWMRGFGLCMFLLTILDLNGTLSINTYAWTIITQSGVTINPELQTLSIPAIMIFGSLVSLTYMDSFGRKPMLICAFLLSTAAHGCLATTLYLQKFSDVTVPGWLPVLAIIVAAWSYAAGVLPLTYVILSEVFNFQVRAKLIGVIVTYAWFVSFIQVFCYQPVTDSFGMHTTFYIFAGFNLIGAIFCLMFQPETVGKSVEEIEKILLGKKSR